MHLHYLVTEAADLQSNGLANSNKNDWPDAPKVSSLQNSENLYKKSSSSSPINDINFKLDQLLETIQTQNCQIAELRNEVADLKKSHSTGTAAPSSSAANVDLNLQKIEVRLSKLIEEYLVRYEREHNKKLDAFVAGR